MGQWTDVATWAGPIRNSGDGDGRPGEPEDRMTGHVGVVIHTAEGTYAGTDAWQRNPAAEVGSHFLTAKDGRCEQLVDTDDRSWCQAAGNSTWLSIENEGWGSRGEQLTAGQVEACARILAKAHLVYGVPLVISSSPSVAGLGWHGMGGAAWGGHYDCPGDVIRAQMPGIVARAKEMLAPQAIETGDDENMSTGEVKAGYAFGRPDGRNDLAVTGVGLGPVNGGEFHNRRCVLGLGADFTPKAGVELRVAIHPPTGWVVKHYTIHAPDERLAIFLPDGTTKITIGRVMRGEGDQDTVAREDGSVSVVADAATCPVWWDLEPEKR